MKILSYPNSSLTTKTIDWDFSQENSEQKLIAMASEMDKVLLKTPNGCALAANQVGYNHRFFLIRDSFASKNGLPMIIVNPIFTEDGEKMEAEEEGCLSFPGVTITTKRFQNINCEYQMVDGEKRTAKLNDFVARMFQHEIEHLDGKTFLDQINRVDRFRIISELKKRKMAGRA